MNEAQERMYTALTEMDSEDLTNLFLDWFGNGMLDDEFEKFMEDEGVL